MTILVTGGAGFIGSNLVDRLLGEGHKVICVDNFYPYYDPKIKRRNIINALKSDSYHLIEGDIRNEELIDNLERAIGKKAIIEVLPMQPGDVEQTYADVSKAASLLDYKPTTPVPEGIKQFIGWYNNEHTA